MLVGQFPPGVFGGAEAQAEQWATRLADRHEITVVARHHSPEQAVEEDRNGFRVHRTPVSSLPGWRTMADLAAISARVRALPERPDLLLCFQTFVSGLAGVRLQDQLNTPAVVWVRGEGEYQLRSSLRARLFSPLVWRRARGVLVQSDANREALLAQLARHDAVTADTVAAKLKVVPNGVAIPATPVRGGRTVLVLGRLIADKGVDVVIGALAGMVTARLVVAGAGAERPRLEALARDRGVDATFLGAVPRDELPGLLAQARCLVMASRSGEGLPNTLLEAMAWGVPVLATPVAGVRDLVHDGDNGLLVPVDDVAATRSGLHRLLVDDALHARLAEAGRRTSADYAWERVQPRLEAALAEWAAEDPHGRNATFGTGRKQRGG